MTFQEEASKELSNLVGYARGNLNPMAAPMFSPILDLVERGGNEFITNAPDQSAAFIERLGKTCLRLAALHAAEKAEASLAVPDASDSPQE